MLTAIQKIRFTLTGSPSGIPHFQHEGEEVTRWLTGGTLPDAFVTFHKQGARIEVRCSTCREPLGYVSDHYEGNVPEQLADIRRAAHQH